MGIKGSLIATMVLMCITSVVHAAFSVWLGPFELELWGGGQDSRYVIKPENEPICKAIKGHKLLEMTMDWEETISDQERKTTTKRLTMEPYVFGRSANGQLVLRGTVIFESLIKEVTVIYGNDESKQEKTEELPPAVTPNQKKTEIKKDATAPNKDATSTPSKDVTPPKVTEPKKEAESKQETTTIVREIVPQNEEGVFSGFFRSTSKNRDRIATINIQRITNIHVIEQSSFNPPKDWEDIFKGNLIEEFCTVVPKAQ